MKHIISIICFFLLITNSCFAEGDNLHKLFSDKVEKENFRGFLDNVLKQTDTEQFYVGINNIIDLNGKIGDVKFYNEMRAFAKNDKPFYFPIWQLKALKHQRKVLAKQTKELIGDKVTNNILEYGTPGAYADILKSELDVKGDYYVVYDNLKPVDFVQYYSLNPFSFFQEYDYLFPSNHYDPIPSWQIQSNSIDVFVMYIGLHHIPTEKVEPFVKSIHRVLKPGGVFILRDHNVTTPKLYRQVFGAHAVFNAVTMDLDEHGETSEIRNFNTLDHWIKIIEKYGLTKVGPNLIQDGDSTDNTLIKFEKKKEAVKNFAIESRSFEATYLSSVEWFIVDSAQEYAEFITHTPFYEFPFMKSVSTMWQIYSNMFSQASEKNGFFSTFFSSYNFMNAFLSITFTLENSIKALFTLIPDLMYSGVEPLFTELEIQNVTSEELAHIDSKIQILSSSANSIIVRMPRYAEFTKIIKKMASKKYIISQIAGNDRVQVKISGDRKSLDAFFTNNKIYSPAYEWKKPTDTNTLYVNIEISTNNLLQFINKVDSSNLYFEHIYDF